MASLYVERDLSRADSGISVRYNNGYITSNYVTAGVASDIYTTGTATGDLNLSKYLYSPVNESTFARIKDTVNQCGTAGAASGIYTTGTATNTAISTSYEMDSPTTGSWVTDYSYNPVNSLDFLFTLGGTYIHNESIEEEKEHEEKFLRDCKIQKIRSNLLIQIKSRAPSSHKEIPENEQIAMETLREYITEMEFRKYLKYGFVLVRGQEGKTYQVFKNRSHTKVWKNGQIIEEICVHLKDRKIPPTDTVIAFRAMIQGDEEAFRKLGNLYNMRRAA